MKQDSAKQQMFAEMYALDEEFKSKARRPKRKRKGSPKILRFRRSERRLHWAIAIPFLVCYTTAIILVFVYNPEPSRPFRAVFSWTHRLSGICLILLPLLEVIRSKGDFRIHFYNIRQAWVWVWDDVKWLCLMGFAAISKRIVLPEQGKFNAAEKLNFMVLMSTYPLYILTGLAIWITDCAFLSWIIHSLMAVIATPLILGHIFMATINPDTRKGLPGMVSGLVDREWAKHHYGRWYKEHFEDIGSPKKKTPRKRSSGQGATAKGNGNGKG